MVDCIDCYNLTGAAEYLAHPLMQSDLRCRAATLMSCIHNVQEELDQAD